MSTDLVPIEKYEIIKAEGAKVLEAIMENASAGDEFNQFDLDRIGFPTSGGKTFSVPTLDGEEDVQTIEGVIIHHGTSRAYWADSTPVEGTPPDCVSDDGEVGYGRADIDRGIAANKDGGYNCKGCRFAQFGSAESGGGQACKKTRPLYIVTAEDTLPKMILVPPSSIKHLRAYGLRIGKRGLVYTDVITRISLKQAQAKSGIKYSEAVFEFAGTVPEEYKEQFSEFSEMVKKVMTGRSAAALAASGAPEMTDGEEVSF